MRPGASRKEIKQAYRDLMRVWHPDRFSGDAALKEKAEKKTRDINEAYQRLMHYHDVPSAAGAPARRSAAEPRRRNFFLDALLMAAILTALFGSLYLYFLVKENAGKMQHGGVTFREWEWDRFFKPGSTKDEVLAVQGPPDRAGGETWSYGDDTVTFLGGRVVYYSNPGGRLMARVLPSNPPALPPGHFTIGSTRDEVLAVQGSPDVYLGDRWSYGGDAVFFKEGKVARYSNPGESLRVNAVAESGTEG